MKETEKKPDKKDNWKKGESRYLFSCGIKLCVSVRHNHGCTSLKEADVASAGLLFGL